MPDKVSLEDGHMTRLRSGPVGKLFVSNLSCVRLVVLDEMV